MIQATLESLHPHMSFLHAESGAEACSLLKKYGQRISLIVSDFYMPEGNGDMVFETWKKDFHFLPLIILSSEIEKARNEILKEKSNPHSRLVFLDKTEVFEKLVDLTSNLLEKSFVSIPLNMVKEETPLNYGLSLALGDKKIVSYAHPNSSIEEKRLSELKNKGATYFLVPFKEVSSNLHHWPSLCLHKKKSHHSPSLVDSYDEFKRLHLAVLKEGNLNKEKLDRASKCLEQSIKKLGESTALRCFLEKDLTVKNYIVNHSFLMALISLMLLDELKLNTKLNREVLIKSCLFHDLFRTDQAAYEHDLIKESFDVRKINSSLMQVLSIARDLKFSRDAEVVVEALFLHRLPRDQQKRNHKLARVATMAHHLASDLYKGAFLNPPQLEKLKKLEDDSGILNALEAIL